MKKTAVLYTITRGVDIIFGDVCYFAARVAVSIEVKSMQRSILNTAYSGTASRKTPALLLLVVLFILSGHNAPFLYAQEEGEYDESPYDGIPYEDDWEGYISDPYTRGDQTFTISLGLSIPTVFVNKGKAIDHNFEPPVGGTGSLAYTYFFGSHLFVGGEIGVVINGTLAKGSIFLVPIGLRAGWQFVFRRFEFPLFAVIGFAPQRYLNLNYVGLFMKGGGGAFYRFNPDWSFGLNVDWNWYPQWPLENGKPNRDKNVDANILGITLSARYHF